MPIKITPLFKAFSFSLRYTTSSYEHNAQLRGEQRYHPNLKHCTVNTKFEVEAKVPSVVNPS
ncbi:hypothetical protein VV86_24385 [Vibrio vulnificus]|nr:hypothetical protein VV86_24385 [Vibrio vulnificus]